MQTSELRMKKYSQVVGLPVFSITTGEKLGEVQDVVFQRKSKKIPALILKNRFIINGTAAVLFSDISSIGKDAVMVRDKSVIIKPSSDITIDRIDLNGISIYTKDGKGIGTVKDVLFDEQTGNIEGVEVSDSLLNDIMSGRNILPFLGNITLSNDNMIIEKEAYEEILHNGGGLKMRLGLEPKEFNEANKINTTY